MWNGHLWIKDWVSLIICSCLAVGVFDSLGKKHLCRSFQVKKRELCMTAMVKLVYKRNIMDQASVLKL